MISNIELSKKYTIYKSFDDNFQNIKQECLKFVKLNNEMSLLSKMEVKQNTIWMEIKSKCFNKGNCLYL